MSYAITPQIFADNVYKILKQRDINTVAFNINFLSYGTCEISNHTQKTQTIITL